MANGDPQTTGSRDMSQRSRRSHPQEKGGQRETSWRRACVFGADCFRWRVIVPSTPGFIGQTSGKVQSTSTDAYMTWSRARPPQSQHPENQGSQGVPYKFFIPFFVFFSPKLRKTSSPLRRLGLDVSPNPRSDCYLSTKTQG